MTATTQRTIESHPRATLAAGAEVMRILSGLDPETQLTVLRWAQSKIKRRSRGTQAPMYSREPHVVTLGHHDAEIRRWASEGLSQRAMALRLECRTERVRDRARVLRERAQ